MAQSVDAVLRLFTNTKNGADYERKFAASRWTDGPSGNPRGGVLPGSGTATVTHASETWSVSPFSAVVSDGAGGAYEVTVSASKSEAMPTRPGSGTSRYDLLVLEATSASGGTNYAQLRLISGSAAASPSVPATPTNAVPIATLLVPAGSTAPTITSVAPRTVTAGGVVPVANAADLATLVAYNGLMAYQEDINAFLRRVNGVWQVAPGQRSWFLGSSGDSPTLATQAQDYDIPGLTQSVTVLSTSDVYLCRAELDQEQVGGLETGIAKLFVDSGSRGPTNLVFSSPNRSSVIKTWRVTGLSAGAHTFKATVQRQGTNGSRVVYAGSTLLIDQVA